MSRPRLFKATGAVISAIILLCWLAACTGSPVPSTSSPASRPASTSTTSTPPATAPVSPGGPGGGAVINSDSVVTAQIKAVRQTGSGYPWELDVLIQSSTDVGSLPNPTKDSVAKVITVKTDQDLSSFKVNDNISARVKYAGDVPRPGITLFIYNIVKN
jgi:hypothetical protein